MLATALLFLLSASAPQASSSKDGLAAVRAVLRRTEGSSRAPDELLVRRLVALGASAGPALFSLVTGEGIEALLVEDAPELWLCEPGRVGELALAALAELPQVPVRELLAARCAEHPERETRVAALRVLGLQGSADGLGLCLELCASAGDELEHPSVHAPAAQALSALLRADGGSMRKLETVLGEAPLPLQRLACEALGQCGRADSVTLLSKFFGRDAALDLAALEGLAQLGERYAWLVGEPVGKRLRSALERGDNGLRAAAARALGRTRDAQAVQALIACLSEPELAPAARWALREITAQARLEQPAEWHAWLEAERAWWQAAGKLQLEALSLSEPTHLVPALRVLSQHPLGRDHVADALCSALPELEPGPRALACEFLGRMGSRRAVPCLVEMLYESSPEVRQAACSALRMLTGQDLPAEPQLWENYAAGA